MNIFYMSTGYVLRHEMNKNFSLIILGIIAFLACVVLSIFVGQLSNHRLREPINASVPLLGGGSLDLSIPRSLRPKIGPGYVIFSTNLDLPGFGAEDGSRERVSGVFLVIQTRPKFGTLALDILSGKEGNLTEISEVDGYRVFVETVPGKSAVIKHFVFDDRRGNAVVVTDAGDWSRAYDWEHAYSEGYEIRAEVDKRYGSNFRVIDVKIDNLINSMVRR